jgi:hypothetical protein
VLCTENAKDYLFFRLLWWLVIDVNAVLGLLYYVVVDSGADVS